MSFGGFTLIFLTGFLLLSVQQHAVVLRPQVQPGRDKVHGEDTDRHWWHEGPWDHQWGLPTHIPGFWEGENIRASGKVCVYINQIQYLSICYLSGKVFLFYFSLFSSEQDKADWLKVHTHLILDRVSEAGKVQSLTNLFILFQAFQETIEIFVQKNESFKNALKDGDEVSVSFARKVHV